MAFTLGGDGQMAWFVSLLFSLSTKIIFEFHSPTRDFKSFGFPLKNGIFLKNFLHRDKCFVVQDPLGRARLYGRERNQLELAWAPILHARRPASHP